MKVIQKKVWVTQLVCRICKKKEQMWHYGEKNKPTKESYPSSGKWNGWDLKEELCWECRKLEELNKRSLLRRWWGNMTLSDNFNLWDFL